MSELTEVRTVLARIGLGKLQPQAGGDWEMWLQHFRQHYTEPLPGCPECGKRLAHRSGKHGAFIGCSGYPKCKYTRRV